VRPGWEWRGMAGPGTARQGKGLTMDDLFGATTPANPMIGLAAKMPLPCRDCGSVNATIESTGTGPHHGSLRCGCGQFRGWLSKQTYEFVTATIRESGKPTEPVVIRTNSSTGE
jgi:hypothetical protein